MRLCRGHRERHRTEERIEDTALISGRLQQRMCAGLAAVALHHDIGIEQRGVHPGQMVSDPAGLPEQLGLVRREVIGARHGPPQRSACHVEA